MAIRYTDIINLIRLPLGNLEIEAIEKKKKNPRERGHAFP